MWEADAAANRKRPLSSPIKLGAPAAARQRASDGERPETPDDCGVMSLIGRRGKKHHQTHRFRFEND